MCDDDDDGVCVYDLMVMCVWRYCVCNYDFVCSDDDVSCADVL